MVIRKIVLTILWLLMFLFSQNATGQNQQAGGYKGIWFTLGQFSEYGDKYSGGLGVFVPWWQKMIL